MPERARHRSGQSDESAVSKLREQRDVLLIWRKDDPVPPERAEVSRRQEARRDTHARHRDVRHVPDAVNACRPRILAAELFQLSLWIDRWPLVDAEAQPVTASRDAEV